VEAIMKPRKLPKTDSIKALARFWDTHDLTDFEDQLEEVAEPVFEEQTVIPLPLKSSEARAVKKLAKARGMADAELIRDWVREKLRAE
jgi:hypothetical protein